LGCPSWPLLSLVSFYLIGMRVKKVQGLTWYPKIRCLLTAPVITSFTPRSRMLLIQIEAPTIFQKILVLLVEGVLFYATARTQRGSDAFLDQVRLRYRC